VNMNGYIAWTLRIGIAIGLVLIVIGELLTNEQILYYGLLILICSPLFAVIVAFLCLLKEKDWFWASIAATVVAIVVSGAVIAMLRILE